VFLDRSSYVYLPLLERLEPRLSDHALVVADLSAMSHSTRDRATHVQRRHLTTEIPLDVGLVVSSASASNRQLPSPKSVRRTKNQPVPTWDYPDRVTTHPPDR
jgi:hypothetical protein